MLEDRFIVEQHKNKKKKYTSAKVVISSVGILALLGGASFLGVKGNDALKEYKEVKKAERVESLISYSIDKNNLCIMPEYVYTGKRDHYEYYDGEKVVELLRKNGADYFYVDGTYYTEDGKKIAILTYTVSSKIITEPIVEEIDGRKYYAAPTGYTLNSDGTCTKVLTKEYQKIVPAKENDDYSEYSGYSGYGEITSKLEVGTRLFSEIAECSLICDVDDNEIADENGMYKAVYRLKR